MKANLIQTGLCAAALLSLAAAEQKTYTVVIDQDTTPEQAANALMRNILMDMSNEALEKRARTGEEEAILELGKRVSTGDYMPDDQEMACRCLRTAATAGDPAAIFEMGRFALHGFGMEKNLQEAAEWFRKAAEAGTSEGWRILGTMIYNGVGTPPGHPGSHQLLAESRFSRQCSRAQ